MGCNSSSVVPLSGSDIVDGAGIKVRINPSTPETVKLTPNHKEESGVTRKPTALGALESSEPPVETLSKDFNMSDSGDRVRAQPPPPPPPPLPPMAFEVPINEDSLIRKHPPKRFRRLEELQTQDNPRALTHELIDSRQQEAEMRRKEILSQRMQSASSKNYHSRKLNHSDAFSQKSEELSD